VGTWAQIIPCGLNLWEEAVENVAGLVMIDRNKLLSAFVAISANEGAPSGI